MTETLFDVAVVDPQGLVTGPTVIGDTKPIWLQPALGDPDLCYTAQDYRMALTMIYPIPGIIRDGSFAVSQNGNGDNTVNIASGLAAVPGTTITAQGNYFVYNPATKNIQPPTPPVSNNRLDAIVLGIEDGQITSTHNYRWYIQVVPGTESATPVLPALPSDSLLLAQILRKPATPTILTTDVTMKVGHASPLGLAAFAPASDLNQIVASGTYLCTSSPATANSPGIDSIVYVGISDLRTQTQIAVELTSASPRMFVRSMWGGTWSSWVQMPAYPSGSSAYSALAVANAADGVLAIAPAIPGVCTLSGDTYTVTRAGQFAVTAGTSIAGNLAHAARIIVDGQTVVKNYEYNWDAISRTLITWVGFLAVGKTIRVNVHNTSGATRTFNRQCWLSYTGG